MCSTARDWSDGLSKIVRRSAVEAAVGQHTQPEPGSPFQIRGPETLKVRLPTVDSRNIGTTNIVLSEFTCVTVSVLPGLQQRTEPTTEVSNKSRN